MYLPVYIQEIPTIKLTIKLLKIHVKFNIKNTIHVLAKINLIYLFLTTVACGIETLAMVSRQLQPWS